jgi:hypothetical protein
MGTKNGKNRIMFDPQEAKMMREAIPSLKNKGMSMTKQEVEDITGITRRSIYRYEQLGAPMYVKFMYDGVRQYVENSLRGTKQNIEEERERILQLADDVADLQEDLDTKVKTITKAHATQNKRWNSATCESNTK